MKLFNGFSLQNSPGNQPVCRLSFKSWIAALALILLAGCKMPLYSGLTEIEANEILSVLLQEGLDAEKVLGDKTFTIEVDKADLSLALSLLKQNALPRPKNATLCNLFKKEGMLSTPGEERVRFLCGVQEELTQTLLRIDGVLDARVHIVTPENDPLADKIKPSSGAVFVKHIPELDVNMLRTQVAQMVSKSVEGLTPDQVSITLLRTANPPPPSRQITQVFSMQMTRESVKNFWLIALIPIVISLLIFTLISMRYRKLITKDISVLADKIQKSRQEAAEAAAQQQPRGR
jgi:type III secretion protein J